MFKLKNRILKSTCSIQKFVFSEFIDKHTFIQNKNFASNFRDTPAFNSIYNTNLMNLLNSLFIFKKNFETVVFMGSNPDILLEKLPKS
jgi:hypothetical protein